MESQKPEKCRLRDSERLLYRKEETVMTDLEALVESIYESRAEKGNGSTSGR